jgi:hypothetical protein
VSSYISTILFHSYQNYTQSTQSAQSFNALEDGKKYGLPWGKTVIITKKIIDLLIKERIQLTTLKDLANLMGWEYRPVFRSRSLGINNQSVVCAPLEAFEEIEEKATEEKGDFSIVFDLTPQ